MKYLRHTKADTGFWINRAHFDATHGRVTLGLLRHHELTVGFSDDAHVIYDQAVFRREYLGEGLAALALFEKAYDLAGRAGEKGTLWFAACNAADLSRSEEEFRHWAALAIQASPKRHPDRIAIAKALESLDDSTAYVALLLDRMEQESQATRHGASAATAEIILQLRPLPNEVERKISFQRAMELRALDRDSQLQSEAFNESIPPEERITLHAALSELARTITLDPYDSELWNYQSAWQFLAARYTESLESAERAIQLRPHGYPRPWVNKAMALRVMGRGSEALGCARKALSIAETSDQEYRLELDDIQRLVERYQQAPSRPTANELAQAIRETLNGVKRRYEVELERHRSRIKQIVRGVLIRARNIGRTEGTAYVPMMAQLLSDFSPEVCTLIVGMCCEKRPEMVELFLWSTLYLVAHSEGIQQRDAARFLGHYFLLSAAGSNIDAARRVYRLTVLALSAIGHGPTADLDQVMRTELGRMHPEFPRAIAEQEPLQSHELAEAQLRFSIHFSGDPHEYEIESLDVSGDDWNSAFDSPTQRLWRRGIRSIHEMWLSLFGSPSVRGKQRRDD